jgi:hypothetical protein
MRLALQSPLCLSPSAVRPALTNPLTKQSRQGPSLTLWSLVLDSECREVVRSGLLPLPSSLLDHRCPSDFPAAVAVCPYSGDHVSKEDNLWKREG